MEPIEISAEYEERIGKSLSNELLYINRQVNRLTKQLEKEDSTFKKHGIASSQTTGILSNAEQSMAHYKEHYDKVDSLLNAIVNGTYTNSDILQAENIIKRKELRESEETRNMFIQAAAAILVVGFFVFISWL